MLQTRSTNAGVELDSRRNWALRPPTMSARRNALIFLMSPLVGEAGGHLAAAVTAVGFAPLLHGFFAIEEGDPDGVFAVLRAQEARQFQHEGGGRAGVIGADEVFFQKSVVVCAEENYGGFLAGDFDEDVFHGQAADGRVGS